MFFTLLSEVDNRCPVALSPVSVVRSRKNATVSADRSTPAICVATEFRCALSASRVARLVFLCPPRPLAFHCTLNTEYFSTRKCQNGHPYVAPDLMVWLRKSGPRQKQLATSGRSGEISMLSSTCAFFSTLLVGEERALCPSSCSPTTVVRTGSVSSLRTSPPG